MLCNLVQYVAGISFVPILLISVVNAGEHWTPQQKPSLSRGGEIKGKTRDQFLKCFKIAERLLKMQLVWSRLPPASGWLSQHRNGITAGVIEVIKLRRTNPNTLTIWLRHLEEKTCQSATCPTAFLTSQTEKAGRRRGTTGCLLSDIWLGKNQVTNLPIGNLKCWV